VYKKIKALAVGYVT